MIYLFQGLTKCFKYGNETSCITWLPVVFFIASRTLAYCASQYVYINALRTTSQEIQCSCIKKTNRLMLLREIMVPYI